MPSHILAKKNTEKLEEETAELENRLRTIKQLAQNVDRYKKCNEKEFDKVFEKEKEVLSVKAKEKFKITTKKPKIKSANSSKFELKILLDSEKELNSSKFDLSRKIRNKIEKEDKEFQNLFVNINDLKLAENFKQNGFTNLESLKKASVEDLNKFYVNAFKQEKLEKALRAESEDLQFCEIQQSEGTQANFLNDEDDKYLLNPSAFKDSEIIEEANDEEEDENEVEEESGQYSEEKGDDHSPLENEEDSDESALFDLGKFVEIPFLEEKEEEIKNSSQTNKIQIFACYNCLNTFTCTGNLEQKFCSKRCEKTYLASQQKNSTQELAKENFGKNEVVFEPKQVKEAEKMVEKEPEDQKDNTSENSLNEVDLNFSFDY